MPSSPLSSSLWNRPYPLLIAAAAMWGGNSIFSRVAVGNVSPMLLTLLRWIFVCFAAWGISGAELRTYWPLLKPKIVKICLSSVLGFTGFNALMYAAAHYTTAVNISIIQGSLPVMVLIGSALLFHMAVTWRQALGIILTLIGVAAIALQGGLQTLLAMSFNRGDMFMLAACVCYAIYILALRNKPAVPGFLFFAILTTAATISSLPLAVYELASGTIVWPTLPGWAIVAAIVIFPSFLAQMCFIRGVELIGPPRAALFINLIPVFGTAFAIAFLHEPLSLVQGAGLTLVLAGIWLAERK